MEEYEYDENGNMTKDLNSNISLVEYNLLNLPSRIEFMDGSTTLYTYESKAYSYGASKVPKMFLYNARTGSFMQYNRNSSIINLRKLNKYNQMKTYIK